MPLLIGTTASDNIEDGTKEKIKEVAMPLLIGTTARGVFTGC